MAVEPDPGQNPIPRVVGVDSPRSPGVAATQAGGLLPGERVVSELESTGGARFQLTSTRVIFSDRRGSGNGTVYASVQLGEISSVQISRRPRARRSAAWGVIGLFSAIGVWQVTPNSTVGIVAALGVALVSLALLADYWIRPAGVCIEFHASGSTIGGEAGGTVSSALTFATEVEDERRRSVQGSAGWAGPGETYPLW